jgi:multimeric flavodoxin WrbA
MKVLGLVGSSRKLGNTEILVKEALSRASENGCEISLIRLTDLHIIPCNGCMSCVFKKAPCRIKDDMNFLLHHLLACDALVLGAPAYLLAPAGIVKMIMDRAYMVSSAEREDWRAKPAATIGVAGIAGWDPFMFPLLNMFPLCLGFSLIDTFIAHAPGPGEVLLVEEYMARARALGEAISGRSFTISESRSMTCPLCRGSVFLIRGMNRAECPSCRISGTFAVNGEGMLQFAAEQVDKSRWSPASIKDHTENWVRFTEGRFKEHLKEIMSKRKPYRAMDNLWMIPQGTEEI